MKTVKAILGALALTSLGAFAGAMLTTDFTTMRSNGASYLPALNSGLHSIWNAALFVVSSVWFWIPFAAIILILVTVRVTVLATKRKTPQTDPLVSLGVRMDKYVNAAHHDQKFRMYGSVYKDTIRICAQFESFISEIATMGFPVPSPQSRDAERWIDLCGDYFASVSPFLRSQQFEQARAVAQTYADQNPPRSV